ncbi:D-serine ammonia-lyase [Leucothrix arctica]|uniref:Probable D-serine dehydratase n=1 Tax=Leucothrix arctica TaxID=1481894 RepID=A0A317C4P0_9GAMM|nr:D-serine ammonia-lyase [Leucothrix arctica]PWQ93615.1 D-serine ammonia-lyase [Leucothrix arctica]
MSQTAELINKYQRVFPEIIDIAAAKEVFWQNPQLKSVDESLKTVDFTQHDVQDAADRLNRFASYIASAFPETVTSEGIIESELVDAPATLTKLENYYDEVLSGRLMLKLDCNLPIAGSIKARGGIYEVLKYAETLAITNGLITISDDYKSFDSEEFRAFFSDYSIVVGSTGNLGLSIGIMGASLGLKATVHMSADARQWKKDLLRSKGVNVIEYESDYSHAVEQGRLESSQDPNSHFVDDESSRDLFLGYAVAAKRMQKQLIEQGITVDAEHPLYIYLPCGVGGGPGGICFGMKLVFGDHVHCYFVEPTHAPAIIIGMGTGLNEDISAQDLGLDGLTSADGLAVSRPSGLVCKAMSGLLDGVFTIDDNELYKLLALVYDAEGIRIEPSSAAGVAGIARVMAAQGGLSNNATHIIWVTGGSMVPTEEWQEYYNVGNGNTNNSY